MSRPPRSHQTGTLSYIQLVANARREVFSDDTDRAFFADLVGRFAPKCRIRVHAFCWSNRVASMVIQVANIPLGSFVRRLASQHARRMNAKQGYQGNLFGARYRETRLRTPEELLDAVQDIHRMPIEEGRTEESPSGISWNSHGVYSAVAKPPAWLKTALVMQAVEGEYGSGAEGYAAFMRSRRPPGSQPKRRAAAHGTNKGNAEPLATAIAASSSQASAAGMTDGSPSFH